MLREVSVSFSGGQLTLRLRKHTLGGQAVRPACQCRQWKCLDKVLSCALTDGTTVHHNDSRTPATGSQVGSETVL